MTKLYSFPVVLTAGLVISLLCFLSNHSQAFMSTDYYQAGSNMYVCASTTTAPAAASAGLSNTPPLFLFNPPGSGVKLVLLDEGVDMTASPAAASGIFLGYSVGQSTGIASPVLGTVSTAYVGQSTGTFVNSQAKCYVSGQLPSTPVFFRALGGTTGASAIGGSQFMDHPNNTIVIAPGGIVSLGVTSAAQVIGHIDWIELPQ